ncbi:MAG: DUF998 domain-containing protein [Streptosporangiales bacterium]|nr:DUF998 domain-containing protein [Streptosporangiales bacterium]
MRALLWCGVVGPVVFVAGFLVLGATRRDYSPVRHSVSSLQLGEWGWLQTANFVLAGLLTVAFAVGLRFALRRYGAGIWAPLIVGLVGVGLVGAGVFATDPISGYPPGTPLDPPPTLEGTLHNAFSTPVFLGLPIACCIVAYRFGKHGHRRWVCYSLATAVVFLLGFIAACLAFAQQPIFAPYGGLFQRATIMIGLAWVFALAVATSRTGGRGRRRGRRRWCAGATGRAGAR